MARTVTPEMAAAANEARDANQARARGKSTQAASEQADQPTRQPVPAGQQRSRGRLILKARTNKQDEVVNCNFPANGCANPARWPVGQQAELRQHPEVKATTVTCTTHLRTILNARNMLGRQAEFETLMLGGQPKPQPKRRRTRSTKGQSATA
jgi:hypothetical protein